MPFYERVNDECGSRKSSRELSIIMRKKGCLSILVLNPSLALKTVEPFAVWQKSHGYLGKLG